jgi:predicted DNA-binding protein
MPRPRPLIPRGRVTTIQLPLPLEQQVDRLAKETGSFGSAIVVLLERGLKDYPNESN